tara:strand:+ start:572 stop:1141 length:570 start_codon:yes stop_codon:yes gene_type:complete
MVNHTGTNYKIPVTIRGITYPSMSAAASSLKVHISTIRGAIDTGRLETVGLYRTHGNPSRESRRAKVNILREAKIIELACKGLMPREIAEKLGITVRAIYYVSVKARHKGLLPPVQEMTRTRRTDTGYKCMARIAERKNVKMGSYRQVIEPLPPGIMHWLVSQVPEGGTVAELVASIITDTYHEENVDE